MIEQIERVDDPRLAHYAHVGDHAWLRDRGLFVAEGRLLARRLVTRWPSSVESILVSPAAADALKDVVPPGIACYVAGAAILQRLTGFQFHRGCLAIGSRPQPLEPEAHYGARRLLALEGIANPDNIGGLFRVAAAFGVEAILLDPTTADPLYRKAIRTSMGAVFSVPFSRIQDWPSGLTALSENGSTLVALTSRGSIRLDDFARSHSGPVILILGSEGSGLSDLALALARVRVRIPTDDSVDSLNVTVAAGIALAMLPSSPPG
ncbi:MAG: RNA methyltransferase [Vicinamibacterales bacterium]